MELEAGAGSIPKKLTIPLTKNISVSKDTVYFTTGSMLEGKKFEAFIGKNKVGVRGGFTF